MTLILQTESITVYSLPDMLRFEVIEVQNNIRFRRLSMKDKKPGLRLRRFFVVY